jgi:cyanophycinase-like exopeptidase
MASDVLCSAQVAVQNAGNHFDVDGNDAATPFDALMIANYLNGNRVMNASLDVDGDGHISDADFAAEVEHLNALDLDTGIRGGHQRQEESGGLGADTNAAAAKKSTTTYTYSVVGNALNSNATPLASGLALVGGGTDVDEVFRWMGTKAHGGDFLVIRATGTDAYNSYIYSLAPSLDSVATLVIPDTTSANDPFVADKIRNAEAIFIAGGDQSDYTNFWSGTPVEAAISYPTSASPLALLNNTITDSHFEQRDRMGRLVAFMGRLDADGLVADAAPLGLGINEETALLVEPNGIGRVVGNPYAPKVALADQQRSVYFLKTNTVATSPLSSPLNYSNIQIARATYDPVSGLGDTLDLVHRTGLGIDSYSISASSAAKSGLTSTQSGGSVY